MRKRHLAALVAVAAMAASGASWADTASQPISYNTTGDSANDASSNHVANANGGEYGAKENHGAYAANGGSGTNGTYGTNGQYGANSQYGSDSANGQYGTNGGSGQYGSNGSSDPAILRHGSGVSHLAILEGGNEVSKDGKADAGDEDGRGAASISIDPEAGTLCFGLVVNNIDGPVAAHIHQGKSGHNGPVVVTLKAPESGNPGAESGCIRHVDRLLLQAIHAHPWAYYVNVHSSAYPDGAIRGQIF